MLRRRAIYPVTTLLTVATAVALFFAGWVLATPAVADPGASATEQAVRAFYAAVNQTIRTGDAYAFDGLVDQHVIVHGPLASLAPDRAGLAQFIVSLHATNPQLEVRVDEVTASSTRAVVVLTVQNGEQGTFLGSPLPDLEPWGAVDALLVNHHRVLELWTDATGIEVLGPSAQIPVAARAAARQVVTLDRMTFDPGGSFTGTGKDEARWLIGEQSGVTVTSTSTQTASPSQTPPTSGSVPLGPGQLLALPTWGQAELRNDRRTKASLLVLTVAAPLAGSASTHGTESGMQNWWAHVAFQGVLIESLTGIVRSDVPTTNPVLAVAHATLAPGAELADFRLAGLCLVVVETGVLDLVAPSAATLTADGTGQVRYAGRLDAGNAALLAQTSPADLRNRGADVVDVTVIAILPAAALTGDKSH